MDPNQKQKGINITAMLAKMCAYFKYDMEPDVQADYLMALLQYPWEHIHKAGVEIINEFRWFPKIVEFREVIGKVPGPQYGLPAPKPEPKSPESIRYGTAHVRLIKAIIAKQIEMPDEKENPIAFHRERVSWLMKYGISPKHIAKVERGLPGWSEYGREVISKLSGGEG